MDSGLHSGAGIDLLELDLQEQAVLAIIWLHNKQISRRLGRENLSCDVEWIIRRLMKKFNAETKVEIACRAAMLGYTWEIEHETDNNQESSRYARALAARRYAEECSLADYQAMQRSISNAQHSAADPGSHRPLKLQVLHS